MCAVINHFSAPDFHAIKKSLIAAKANSWSEKDSRQNSRILLVHNFHCVWTEDLLSFFIESGFHPRFLLKIRVVQDETNWFLEAVIAKHSVCVLDSSISVACPQLFGRPLHNRATAVFLRKISRRNPKIPDSAISTLKVMGISSAETDRTLVWKLHSPSWQDDMTTP